MIRPLRRYRGPRRGCVAALAVAALCALIAAAAWIIARGPAPRDGSDGWLVTIYYTAVESFHHGDPVDVTGCPVLDCNSGSAPLGTYPSSFVAAVREEGTGRITAGPHSGEYLNWSAGVGYWLDVAPRDAYGDPLLPFTTAAAEAIPAGTDIRVRDCGTGRVGGQVCGRLQGGDWRVHDLFTPGLGGDRHIDLYIGEQDRPAFTDSPMYATLRHATVAVG